MDKNLILLSSDYPLLKLSLIKMKRLLFLFFIAICIYSIQAEVLLDIIEVESYSIGIDTNGDSIVDSYYIHPSLNIYVLGSDAIPPDIYYIDFNQDGIIDLYEPSPYTRVTSEFFVLTFVERDTSGKFIRENQVWHIVNDTISPAFVNSLKMR